MLRANIYLQVHPGVLIGRKVADSKEIRLESEALSHPRSLMGDFLAIQMLFREMLGRLKPGFLAPRLLIHLVPEAAGGYTDVEQRAFLEAGRGAGASGVRIHLGGQPLTDAEVVQLLKE
jgi:hypothetical protein